jgi:hypothetical protein
MMIQTARKGIKMAINFANVNLEVIDINTNASPDIFVNKNGVTFTKRVLEDLNYPQNVQYCIDPENHVFAIKPCKGNEVKATSFSKSRGEDASFFLCKELISGYLDGVTGEYKTSAGYFVDEAEAEKFDKQFPYKEKLKLPGQLV